MNTKLNWKCVIAGLTMLFSLQAVNATTIDIGNLTSYANGYTNATVTPVGAFTDYYNFTLPTLSNLGGTVQNAPLSLSFSFLNTTYTMSYNTGSLSMTLLQGGNPITNPGTSISLSNLTSGLYSFKITGNGIGTNGGSYAFGAFAAPVPEPSTWAMMLGGLGLIGFMTYRRRQYL